MPHAAGKIRVLIVDDSEIVRDMLQEILEREKDIEVVGFAEDGDEVLQRARELEPDVVTMDVHMQRVSGIEATRQLMSEYPLPVLVVTSLPAGPDTELSYLAIAAGAMDIAEKPYAWNHTAQSMIVNRVRMLANVEVSRAAPNLLWEMKSDNELLQNLDAALSPGCRIIGLVTSASGASTVARILAELPATFPAALAVVPHVPPGFIESFASFLQNRVELTVEVVEQETTLRAGHIYVPANDRHLVVSTPSSLNASREDPVNGLRPSAGVLFQSMARHFKGLGMGVVLSGLDVDGVEGLVAMRRAGALTIAEDPSGSPAARNAEAAVAAGGVEHVLPAQQIAPFLLAVAGASQLNTGDRR